MVGDVASSPGVGARGVSEIERTLSPGCDLARLIPRLPPRMRLVKHEFSDEEMEAYYACIIRDCAMEAMQTCRRIGMENSGVFAAAVGHALMEKLKGRKP
jgi:hypothetical protein